MPPPSASCPTTQKAAAAAPEPIIIEKESLDDLNHANRSPWLRAGQSRQPISNNGFHRHRTKLGNAYWHGAARRNYNCFRPAIRYSFVFVELTLNRKLKEPSRLAERKNAANLSARIWITRRKLRVWSRSFARKNHPSRFRSLPRNRFAYRSHRFVRATRSILLLDKHNLLRI